MPHATTSMARGAFDTSLCLCPLHHRSLAALNPMLGLSSYMIVYCSLDVALLYLLHSEVCPPALFLYNLGRGKTLILYLQMTRYTFQKNKSEQRRYTFL